MHLSPYQTMPRQRDENRSPAMSQRAIEKHIAGVNGSTGIPRTTKPDTRIIRASEVLSLLPDGSKQDASGVSPGVENFQEALRLFPPFRDDDASILGATDVQCPDCDAVFSSSDELQQHYLSRYCPGAAVAIYMMTRDPLITKGYRMEKRYIPLQCQSLRIFCVACEQTFSIREVVPRQKDMPLLVECVHCGNTCNLSYEPTLPDPRDDPIGRALQNDLTHGNRGRTPSISRKPLPNSQLPVQSSEEEPSLAKKAKRIRDSWSFRKMDQGVEDELVAVSFASLYDLERVHAPSGTFQQFGTTVNKPLNNRPSVRMNGNGDHDHLPVTDSKTSPTTVHEDNPSGNVFSNSDGDLPEGNGVSRKSVARNQSLLHKIFGRKTSKDLSRSNSTADGKKLVKRANSVPFSFVSNTPTSTHAITPMGEGKPDAAPVGDEVIQAAHNMDWNFAPEFQHDSFSNGNQNPFIHMQIRSGGAIVHDASGRQRILKMDEIAKLYSQLKDDLIAASAWGRVVTTRLRAESALRSGNLRNAIVDFHEALKTLEDTPAVDVENISRSAILCSLGQAYKRVDMPVESEACYLESLELSKRTFGRDHFKNFAILQELGTLCEKDGYPSEAAALYDRAFAGRLKTLGNNDPETLNTMQDLASLKISLGEFKPALLLLEKAVPSLEPVFGLQSEKTLDAMNKLSLLYQRLGRDDESHAICNKAITPCKATFGINELITMDFVGRFLQTSEHFDFPPDVMDIVDQYKQSQDPDALRVIHRLGRSYMDAGFNRDAAHIFQGLFENILDVKGAESPETFDALSALCVCFEHLDDLDNAILSYQELVQMAGEAPEDHHSRKRIPYAEKRIKELNRRRSILTAEKGGWGLLDAGPCANCGCSTTVLCSTCKITRFCSENCHKLALSSHQPHCVPSVSLRESRSLSVKSECPTSIQQEAITRIPYSPNDNGRTISMTASYTFSLDPRNFSTFHMKLSSTANTIVLFSTDSDIKYTKVINTSHTTPDTPVSSSPVSPQEHLWFTPSTKDSIIYTPTPGSTESAYLIVGPGDKLLEELVEERLAIRQGGGEGERFRALKFPNQELIEYAQGMLLSGQSAETFMYVIEWEWK